MSRLKLISDVYDGRSLLHGVSSLPFVFAAGVLFVSLTVGQSVPSPRSQYIASRRPAVCQYAGMPCRLGNSPAWAARWDTSGMSPTLG